MGCLPARQAGPRRESGRRGPPAAPGGGMSIGRVISVLSGQSCFTPRRQGARGHWSCKHASENGGFIGIGAVRQEALLPLLRGRVVPVIPAKHSAAGDDRLLLEGHDGFPATGPAVGIVQDERRRESSAGARSCPAATPMKSSSLTQPSRSVKSIASKSCTRSHSTWNSLRTT